MIDSKLVQIYLSLDKEEHRLLKKWVVSPIADVHIDTPHLIAFLDSRKTYTVVTLEKNKVFSYLYPEAKEYDDLRLRHAMSHCTKTLEDFLVYSYSIKNKTQQEIILIKSLQQHRLPKQAETVLQKIKKQRQEKHSLNFYLETIQLYLEEYRLLSYYGNNTENELNIQEIIDSIQKYTASAILKYANLSITHQRYFNKDYSIIFFPFIIELIENKKIPFTPYIEIYYYIYKSFNDTKENTYLKKLIEVFYKYNFNFDTEEIYLIHAFCKNHLISKKYSAEASDKSSSFFADTLWQLYKHGLKKKHFFEINGEIDRNNFYNFVRNGILQKDFDTVETFIEKNRKYLNQSYAKETIMLCKVQLYVAKKNYKEAMLILASAKFIDIQWNLLAKFTLLKIYFEIKDYNSIPHLINAIKVYLFRKKKIGRHKEIYIGTTKFFEKLYETIGASRQKKEELKNEIKLMKQLPNKDWFLEQLGE